MGKIAEQQNIFYSKYSEKLTETKNIKTVNEPLCSIET
jgi:hypothetical protein